MFRVMMTFVVPLLLIPIFAMSQELPPVSDTDFFLYVIQSLGSLKGAGALAIAYFVSQLILKFMATPLAMNLLKGVKGPVKLTVVLAVNLLSGVLSLMVLNGMTLGPAIMHSTTLAAFSVLFNQIYKQYVEKQV